VCRCVGHTGELWKNAEPIDMPFDGSKELHSPDGATRIRWRSRSDESIRRRVGHERRCGLLPNYFGHLLFFASKISAAHVPAGIHVTQRRFSSLQGFRSYGFKVRGCIYSTFSVPPVAKPDPSRWAGDTPPTPYPSRPLVPRARHDSSPTFKPWIRPCTCPNFIEFSALVK